MSRRRKASTRKVVPDLKYKNTLLEKFINKVMKNGKKSVSRSIVYKALDTIKEKHSSDPIDVFLKAVDNTKPSLEVRSVRVGGSNYQVPCPIEDKRSYILSIRWLIKASNTRSEKSMTARLSEELFEAYSEKGGAIKLRDEMHRMAEANRAFAHFNPKKKSMDKK